MTEVSARSVALDCLMAVAEDGQFSHTVLNSAREKYAWMSAEDRSFFGRLVHGTLEYLYQLDRILDRYSTVKTRKMKPAVRNILRMSVYQILYLDRVPLHAVTNEAVKLTERRGLRGLKGFVNAVLRHIGTDREKILASLEKSKDLSFRCSCPEWLTKRFREMLGEADAETVLRSFLLPGRFYVRRNDTLLRKTGGLLPPEGAGDTWTESPYLPGLFLIEGDDSRTALEALRAGTAYAQDLSSALAVRAAAPLPGQTVIDLCAAPGGKSAAAADLMNGEGTVFSFDLTEGKVSLIRENALRTGFQNVIRPEENDALQLREDLKNRADLVIADLPCSGLGVIGRKPDIRLRVTEEGILSLAAMQKNILENAASYVKPGGTLLFSTCTITREENTENLTWFLERHPEFRGTDLRKRLPELSKEAGTETLRDGFLQLLPGKLPCDGFFFAVLQKADGNE